MSTLRPDGAWVLFYVFNYKHCVPTGLGLSRGRRGSAIVMCFIQANGCQTNVSQMPFNRLLPGNRLCV